MFIILSVSSPDEVELWEALVTLAMFPILVIFAYAQDRKYFKCLLSGRSKVAESTTLDEKSIQNACDTDRPVRSEVEESTPVKKSSYDNDTIGKLKS